MEKAVPFLNMWERRKLIIVLLSKIMDLSEKKVMLFESSFIFYVCGILPSKLSKFCSNFSESWWHV